MDEPKRFYGAVQGSVDRVMADADLDHLTHITAAVGLSQLIRVEEFTTSRREHPATARMITAAEIGHSTAGEQLGARNRAGQQLSALLFARGRLRPAGPSEALPAAADVVDGLPGRACDLLNRAGLLERPEPRFYLP